MAYSKAYYEANKPKFNSWAYKWQKENREQWLAYRRRWRAENRERLVKENREYNSLNRERKSKAASEWCKNNRDRIKARPTYYMGCRKQNLKRAHNMTLEEYNELNTKQNGLCACCGKPPSNGKPLYVDHNHRTEKRRALICSYCNMVVGIVESGIVDKVKIYLEKYDG